VSNPAKANPRGAKLGGASNNSRDYNKNRNKFGKAYPLENTNIPKAFFNATSFRSFLHQCDPGSVLASHFILSLILHKVIVASSAILAQQCLPTMNIDRFCFDEIPGPIAVQE
jgi:hypothetical protein